MANENFLPLQAQPFLLAGAGQVIGDTSITLQSFQRIDGTPITMAMLGTTAYMTLEPGNGTQEEQIVFTGVTQNTNGTATLTGVSDVAMQYPYTTTSGLLITHAGATTAILSNTSGFYNQFIAKNDDATVTGLITFSSAVIPTQDSYLAPTLDAQFAPKKYVDDTAVSGAPNAGPTTKGIVQIATQAQVDAKTIVGSTSAYLVTPLNTQRSTLLSDYVLDTSTSPNVIVLTASPAITAYTTGQIFSFKLANTNTSPVVTVNVNGLGAKSIVKLDGATSPAVGDMVAGQMIIVEYASPYMQMMNPVANAPLLATSAKFGGTGVDGALSATSGTTTINCAGSAVVIKNYTTISLTGTAVLALSNPSANGTIVILKSQGNVTITSSTSPTIDLRGMGAAKDSDGIGLVHGPSTSQGNVFFFVSGPSTETATSLGGLGVKIATSSPVSSLNVFAGAGGQSGTGLSGNTPGVGGAGAGGMLIECAGALNITSTINISGSNGTSGSGSASGGGTNFYGAGGGSNSNGGNGYYIFAGSAGSSGGSGGGGGGGSFVAVYNSLVANTATIVNTGGSGGTNAAGGGSGYSSVIPNTEFI